MHGGGELRPPTLHKLLDARLVPSARVLLAAMSGAAQAAAHHGSIRHCAATWRHQHHIATMSAMKNIPAQMQNLQNGKWQQGVGKGLFGRRIGLYGYGRIAKRVAEYAEAVGMQVEWWGSADGRARAQADGRRIAKDRAGFFAENDIEH